MNSCQSSADSPWLWIFLFENLLLYILYKIPPAKAFDLFTLLFKKVKAPFNTKKQIGRPLEYWKIYHHVIHMLRDNIRWGASKIHSELLMLGFNTSLSTVKRIIKRIKKPNGPFQGWKAWLFFLSQIKNYTVATDLCRIQTVYGSTLYALAFIHIGSRKIVHFNITLNPTRDWVLRQIQEAKSLCPNFDILLRDNDVLFSGSKIMKGLKELEIASIVTPPASPWCNGIMERWFGSLRRECFNPIPVFSLNHAQFIAGEYINYYNFWRPHLALNKDSPSGRVVSFPTSDSKLIKRKVLSGLHHVYFHSEVA
ncbi:integrase core domain-containing protein [Leptospira weilii]|uniref:integrase core domain-containing protein n=1 Tax=Leptospira weilii TaxID=28184 RepID=UPI001EF33847|nr:integrase core domain-containing protein [Leptospira weilii]ULH30495.1 integrase core domain-containing protein [Leptospira weilii]UPY78792.1 integrase core domain-containing protein [Leptospira weilii]